MAQPVTTKEQLLRQLQLGLVPATENREILLELGFQPLYPQAADGYHEHLWGRPVSIERRSRGCLQMAIQRAYLAG
jgi:hypothetical protein